MLKPPTDKISAETREKLLALADYVEADTRHALRMESFLSPFISIDRLHETPPVEWCGTAACLAGYLAIMRGDSAECYRGDQGQFFSRGMHDLGITGDQAVRLFLGYPVGQVTRSHAVRVPRHFAYTGDVDWNV